MISGTLLLASCSAPARKPEPYPRPLPKKSAKLLLSEARKHIGEPYHYGGTSRKGWDCSGFVRTMYHRSLNIDLPHSSAAMHQSCTPVPLSHARPGDLVFFKIRPKRISHVGIYVGNNKFIHASRSDGVVITSLDDPYYRHRFVGLRRLAPGLVAAAR